MTQHSWLNRQIRISSGFAVMFAALVVGLNGLFILATTLLDQVGARRGSPLTAIIIDGPLLIGISLLYLSTQLRRRKLHALYVTLVAYAIYLGVSIAGLIIRGPHDVDDLLLIRSTIVPLAVLVMLLSARREFVVRSDFEGFRGSLRFSVFVLLVALVYGVTGFTLMDKHDFHQEIAIPTAIHYTFDQFDLTTKKPLQAYTKRSHLFINSLSYVSLAAVGYAVLALFQPIRLRFIDQTSNREQMARLLETYPAKSEDFFKLWPHDKQYYFDAGYTSGLAFHVHRGVALVLGDPAGDPKVFPALLTAFSALCYGNDWTPAFIHTEDTRRRLYEKRGFNLQKIGEEAVVDIEQFQSEVAGNKYFRQINNRFTKQGFSHEYLLPPHHAAVVQRLEIISKEWLSTGGRTERRFAMGYFSEEYMQQCPIMVVRDAAGTIQAYLNQLPAHFDASEGTYDLLRHAKGSPGNINDFLLIGFMGQLKDSGATKLNLGLCPLVGLEDVSEADKSVIDGILRFAYANGDRLYSFSGLYRFKAKYQPEWRDRYIVYKGGVRGFTRVTNALMRTMQVKD